MSGASNQIEWRADARTDSSSIVRMGLWSVGVSMIVFLLWSIFFPLASAVITPGTFVSEGRNKLVQHAAGGSVKQIFAEEGMHLVEGQPVIELDTASVQAQLTQLQARHASLRALKARLDAERSNGLRSMAGTAIRFGEIALRGSVDPKTADAVDSLIITEAVEPTVTTVSLGGGNELLESHREAYIAGQTLLSEGMDGFAKKIDSLKKQQAGITARIQSQSQLLKLTTSEYHRLKPLAKQGFVARSRLEERERSMLELKASVEALEFDRLGLETQIAEVRVQMRKLRAETSANASIEYSKIVGELAEISDQLVAAKAAVDGSIVRAPATGTLVHLSASTIGGVVSAGDRIGEIVPEGTPLIVQARVLPGDIDHVKLEQEADITVTAFNRRIDDQLRGRVIYKSADAERDEKTGDPYFTVRLSIAGVKGQGQSRLGDIQAGMQSEVYIHTGSRTFLTYLVNPIVDSFRRAFREQ